MSAERKRSSRFKPQSPPRPTGSAHPQRNGAARPGRNNDSSPVRQLKRRLASLEVENRELRQSEDRSRHLLESFASEAKFRQVIDASPVPLSVDDMRGSIEYLNQKFVEWFGYSHAEVPTSAAWFARAYPNPEYRRQVAEEWKACLQKGLRAGKQIGPLEVEVTCKDGSLRRVEFVGTLLGSRLLIAANDVTERRRLEKQILEISDQEQERIGQDLHDGLCQLLSGIKFKATLLEQKLQAKAPAEARDARTIEAILNSAIQQARNLARGLHPVDLEARGLMSALEELAGSVASVYGVSCVCQFKQPVLVHDHLVATHLYRIAQEALNNALKHGQARRIWIRLAATRQRLTLSVRDNGRGFPARPRKRTGMGLALMHYRARTIGASLQIRPGPRRGTVVNCWLRRPIPRNHNRR
jgi:two-component system, LuxR family, sensor kinase FixL